jgi:hypothetical protein
MMQQRGKQEALVIFRQRGYRRGVTLCHCRTSRERVLPSKPDKIDFASMLARVSQKAMVA